MRTCMHAYMHTCMHDVYTCIHVCMRDVYTCIHVCMNACMHTCMHDVYACIHVCMRTCMHTCMHACIHAYMLPCIHAHTHTRTHAYTHACTQMCIGTALQPSSWCPRCVQVHHAYAHETNSARHTANTCRSGQISRPSATSTRRQAPPNVKSTTAPRRALYTPVPCRHG